MDTACVPRCIRAQRSSDLSVRSAFVGPPFEAPCPATHTHTHTQPNDVHFEVGWISATFNVFVQQNDQPFQSIVRSAQNASYTFNVRWVNSLSTRLPAPCSLSPCRPDSYNYVNLELERLNLDQLKLKLRSETLRFALCFKF